MVEEDYLGVVVAFDLNSLGAIAWRVHVRVHINHLPISLIPEQQTFVIVSIDSEIRRIIQSGMLCVPVEEAEISWFG